jgi:CO/xanthine dehydrogenase Mo-binding subunit
MKNPTFLDYRLLTPLDVPMIGTEIIEVPADDGPYGIRGTGEIPLVPPLATIANAIYDAIGVRPDDAPMTSEVVFKLLKARESQQV